MDDPSGLDALLDRYFTQAYFWRVDVETILDLPLEQLVVRERGCARLLAAIRPKG